MNAIRHERPRDSARIDSVILAAFGSMDEVKLVQLVRARGEAVLSLVAERDDEIIGQALLTPIILKPAWPAPLRLFGLGPISVAPEYQRAGVGSSLMHAAIEESRTLEADAIFLLGDPGYYERFGFRETHIGNEYGVTREFMVLELREKCLRDVRATAHYVAAFGEAGA